MKPNLPEVKVLSKKYDGSLRESYKAYLLEETDELITLFVLPNTPSWDYRKDKLDYGQDGILETYFKHKWFNVMHICEQHSGINLSYINLATPIIKVADGFEWIDLDLDYRVHLDGSVELLDENEYLENSKAMNYSSIVLQNVTLACQEIEKGLLTKDFPFKHKEHLERYLQVKKDYFYDHFQR